METGFVALYMLLVLCHSSFTQGETSTPLPSLTFNISSTSFPQNSSAGVNVSDHSVDHHLAQDPNATSYSTAAPASPAAAAGNASYSLDATNDTSAAGNVTESHYGTPGDNQTLPTQTPVTTSSVLNTSTQNANPEIRASSTTQSTWMPSASTRPLISISTYIRNSTTTSSVATTPQSGHRFTTTVIKGTTESSKPQTTESSMFQSSTPVVAKAHVDSPSELNVGDDEPTSSTDPLLVGLVSVFVVTAAAISLLIFLKFRHKNEQPEFRRLQDLPMDDMMEDTPLSMYSY